MRFLTAVMLGAFALIGCAGTPKHPTWNSATGAEQHERLMWQAIHDQDWAGIERHLAPTFVGVNAAGRSLDRAGWLEYWKGAHLGEFSLGEAAVRPEGADMVVTYTIHMGPTPPNSGFRWFPSGRKSKVAGPLSPRPLPLLHQIRAPISPFGRAG